MAKEVLDYVDKQCHVSSAGEARLDQVSGRLEPFVSSPQAQYSRCNLYVVKVGVVGGCGLCLLLPHLQSSFECLFHVLVTGHNLLDRLMSCRKELSGNFKGTSFGIPMDGRGRCGHIPLCTITGALFALRLFVITQMIALYYITT